MFIQYIVCRDWHIYLSAVSHSTDIAEGLQDDNSDTEVYSWDESAEPSALETNGIASSAMPAVDSTSTVMDNLREICWSNVKAKIVLVPCGHARFCDSCAQACFATTQKCGLCRKKIDF